MITTKRSYLFDIYNVIVKPESMNSQPSLEIDLLTQVSTAAEAIGYFQGYGMEYSPNQGPKGDGSTRWYS